MRIFMLTLTTLLLLALRAGGEGMEHATPAPLEPVTQNGVEFLSGGVGDDEQQQLLVLDSEYNLRVSLTNAEGAFLHGVDVTLENAAGETLVETTTRGPVLLVRLEPGRYVLHARTEGRSPERRVIDVPKEEQVRLYVALPQTGDDVAAGGS